MSSSSESSDPTVSPEQRKETDIVPPGPKSTSNVLGRDAANSFAYRTSVSDIPGKITTTATETINSVKKTVVDDTLPAAADALNNAQARVSTLISRDNGPDDTTQDADASDHIEDHQHIDQMHPEQLCDFLREQYKSNAPPPRGQTKT